MGREELGALDFDLSAFSRFYFYLVLRKTHRLKI